MNQSAARHLTELTEQSDCLYCSVRGGRFTLRYRNDSQDVRFCAVFDENGRRLLVRLISSHAGMANRFSYFEAAVLTAFVRHCFEELSDG